MKIGCLDMEILATFAERSPQSISEVAQTRRTARSQSRRLMESLGRVEG